MAVSEKTIPCRHLYVNTHGVCLNCDRPVLVVRPTLYPPRFTGSVTK